MSFYAKRQNADVHKLLPRIPFEDYLPGLQAFYEVNDK